MDSTGRILLVANELYARSNSTTSAADEKASRPAIYKVVGLILAISSGLFIGVSFVLKKMGLLKANVKYNEEAGEGYGYLKNAFWWGGMTLMIIGEICNFVAYAFVDAILVTPLGALSVVVTTILSAIFLKERLSFVGKVGCFNCIVGSVVIVINAPEQSAVSDIQDMKKLVISPGFLSYAGVIIVACTVIALWLGPKYGKRTMMVYLSICSLIGGLSVVATQGLGAAIVAAIDGKSQFKEWFFYVLLVFVVATLLTEIIYLNKALNLFNAALVTPTYYVFFTSSTIVTSAVLFRGFKGTAATISTVIMGFLQICSGVVLLQLSKSAKDVPDTAVFKGDLDQVRTVAEQEEPEYEPRADTIRGGASILRSMSRARTEKQAMEVKRLQEEQMEPIGEDEQIEWDGLRRRRTTLGSRDGGRPSVSRAGTLARQKTVHPPLGMSRFPTDDHDSDDDTSYHPGFFQRLRSRGKSTNTAPSPALGLSSLAPASHDGTSDHHSLDTDTSYKPHDSSSQHIQFAPDPSHSQSSHSQSQSSLHPPKPPPHTAKRQFSFNNVFSGLSTRTRSGTGESSESKRPTSRNSRKASSSLLSGIAGHHIKSDNNATEEERLGLVKGDSQVLLPIPSRDSRDLAAYSDNEGDDWGLGGRRTGSPERGGGGGRELLHERGERGDRERERGGDAGRDREREEALRRYDTEDTLADDWDKEEKRKKGGGSSGAFL